jgi:hypothetical protein
MFLLAAVATLASAAPAASGPRPAFAEARVSVRIISGARVKLDGSPNHDVPAAHEAVVHTDGKAHGARLIEFE